MFISRIFGCPGGPGRPRAGRRTPGARPVTVTVTATVTGTVPSTSTSRPRTHLPAVFGMGICMCLGCLMAVFHGDLHAFRMLNGSIT